MSSFDSDEMENLRVVINKRFGKSNPIPSGQPDEVWKQIQNRLKEKCETGKEECIIAALLRRPKAPKEWALDRSEWLTSDDIDDIEKSYTELFKDYFYVGSVPIDFDLKSETGKCLVSALCSLKLSDLHAKGKHRIGIAINTDPHDGPGQHWVALFCDIRPELAYPRVTYFDSYAQHPEKEIQTLMRRWKSQWDATGVHKQPMKLTYNKLRHQYKDSECGMYCVYFHYACIMNISMDERIPDEVINSFRNLLFRMPKIESGNKE